eukprot:40475-Eustigmatos_ZCMA.PRE.1
MAARAGTAQQVQTAHAPSGVPVSIGRASACTTWNSASACVHIAFEASTFIHFSHQETHRVVRP